jgi:hypothetical protein
MIIINICMITFWRKMLLPQGRLTGRGPHEFCSTRWAGTRTTAKPMKLPFSEGDIWSRAGSLALLADNLRPGGISMQLKNQKLRSTSLLNCSLESLSLSDWSGQPRSQSIISSLSWRIASFTAYRINPSKIQVSNMCSLVDPYFPWASHL